MDVDPDTVNLTPAIGNEHGKWEDNTPLLDTERWADLSPLYMSDLSKNIKNLMDTESINRFF